MRGSIQTRDWNASEQLHCKNHVSWGPSGSSSLWSVSVPSPRPLIQGKLSLGPARHLRHSHSRAQGCGVSAGQQAVSPIPLQCSLQGTWVLLGRPYLDPADGLLCLHHSDVFGWVPLREQLGGAQVVGSKDDPIDEVFWLTGPWN